MAVTALSGCGAVTHKKGSGGVMGSTWIDGCAKKLGDQGSNRETRGSSPLETAVFWLFLASNHGERLKEGQRCPYVGTPDTRDPDALTVHLLVFQSPRFESGAEPFLAQPLGFWRSLCFLFPCHYCFDTSCLAGG